MLQRDTPPGPTRRRSVRPGPPPAGVEQGPSLSALQGSLFGAEPPAVAASAPVERLQLDDRSWVDVIPGWLRGGDELFAELVDAVGWEAVRRPMFDRMVDVPRLTGSGRPGDQALPSVLTDGARWFEARYRRRFDHLGFNLYRDGADSVAWHGDRVGRHVAEPVIGVLTVGSARPFLLRPAGGGPSQRLVPGSGDLVVMGGRSQSRFEHAVPKVARCGPRISVTFRCGADEDRVPGEQRRRLAGRSPTGGGGNRASRPGARRETTPRGEWEWPR